MARYLWLEDVHIHLVRPQVRPQVRHHLQAKCVPQLAKFFAKRQVLKIRNLDSFSPFVKWGIVNWKIIPFMIQILVPIPPKCAKNGQGIGILILYESESRFFMNQNRPTSSPRPVSVIFWTNTTVKPSPWPSWLRWQLAVSPDIYLLECQV